VTITATDWQASAVPLILALGAIVVLIADVLRPPDRTAADARARHIVAGGLSSIAVVAALVVAALQRNDVLAGFCPSGVGGPAAWWSSR
jgi:NADH-quinone oxidoreductase subunit N